MTIEKFDVTMDMIMLGTGLCFRPAAIIPYVSNCKQKKNTGQDNII